MTFGRLGADYSPVRADVLALATDRPESASHTFWFMPISIFGMLYFTRCVADSLTFTILPKPSPLPRDARGFASLRGVCFTLAGSGYIVGMASNIAVTSKCPHP